MTGKNRKDGNMSDTDEESVVSMSVSSCYTAHQMIDLARKENGLQHIRAKLRLLDFSAAKIQFPRTAVGMSDPAEEGELAPNSDERSLPNEDEYQFTFKEFVVQPEAIVTLAK